MSKAMHTRVVTQRKARVGHCGERTRETSWRHGFTAHGYESTEKCPREKAIRTLLTRAVRIRRYGIFHRMQGTQALKT